MPRSARPGASSRSAIRFKAPRGSPAASARAAAVISESIAIPPHLSLPPFPAPALSLSHEHQRRQNMMNAHTPNREAADEFSASPDGNAPPLGAADWLRLAAAPTFAIMALL